MASALSVTKLSCDNTFQAKANNTRVKPSVILSSVFPIQARSSSNEQSAGLGTGEEGMDTSSIMVTNVVSFDMTRNGNALKKSSTLNDHTYAKNIISSSNYDEDDEDEDDERIIKGRERNREHARKTRLRKKAQLQELEQKYRTMLAERQALNQQLQDRNIASILLGLSSSAPLENTITPSSMTSSIGAIQSSESTSPDVTIEQSNRLGVMAIVDRKADLASADASQVSTSRKRGFPEVQLPTNISPLTININGIPTAINSKSHINWKTGMYCDEMGRQSQLTPQQLEDLRRERNRMHAKMTRDRKKCFISTMEKAIDELEKELASLRCCLLQGQRSTMNESSSDNKVVTPELTARPSPTYTSVPADHHDMTSSNPTDPSMTLFCSDRQHQRSEDDDRSTKRIRHGFSLDE